MFNEKFEEILSLLDVSTSSEFARCAGFDRSYISRVRSGGRIPQRGSRAAANLIQAIYDCAAAKNKTKTLSAMFGCGNSREELSEKLEDFVFENEKTKAQRKPAARVKHAKGDYSVFGERLTAAMVLAQISNVRLARAANVDASVISRYRRGLSAPVTDAHIADSVAAVLLARIAYKNRNAELGEMIGGEVSDAAFKTWLYCYDAEQPKHIDVFLKKLDSFNINTIPALPSFSEAVNEEILNDGKEVYIGKNGLQKAVLRFLGNAVKDGTGELWLYSDMKMDWMTESDFFGKWASLMLECVRAGIRIKIIHNIDRGLREMLSAISGWMPLYMSGMIESYYSTVPVGGRFLHTIFLKPGSSCIVSCCAKNDEENARYRYDTSSDYFQEQYEALLADCRPLVRIEKRSADMPEPELSFENIGINMTEQAVRISYRDRFDFVITHPLMHAAFCEYLKTRE